MNRIFIAALFSMVCFSSSAFSAAAVQNCDSKTEKGFVHIMKGTGDAARNPTLEELFNAFNADAKFNDEKPPVLKSPFLELVKYEEGKKIQPELYVEVPGKDPVYYYFPTVPYKGKRDPRCTDQTINGYDCRIKQLKEDDLLDGLPNGLKTGVVIKVPSSAPEVVEAVSKALGCGEVLDASGKPILKAVAPKPVDETGPLLGVRTAPTSAKAKAKAPKPAAAASAPSSAASGSKSNVIPAIQLQAVPAAPAAPAPAASKPTVR